MSKTAFEGQKRYDALRKAQRGDQHKAARGASAATAVAPRLKDKGEGVALRAHPSVVGRTHCDRHCDTCLTAQECVRDEVFSARASMSRVLAERAGVTAAEVPAGADVDAVEAAARRKAAPCTEERVATTLLDSSASRRNFISSSLASWLRVRGSTVSADAGETGLA